MSGHWIVQECCYYPDEPCGRILTMSVRPYASEEDAVKILEEVIRNEWTTTVLDGIGGEVALADKRGYADCPGDPKRSEVYYSKDGKTAWAFFSDGHGYKGEVVQI